MNILDIVFAVVASFFLLRGIFRGLLVEIASLGGVAVGFFVANKHHAELIPYAQKILNSPAWAATAAYLAVFVAVIVVVTLVASIISRALPLVVAWFNYLAGGLLGLAKGALICLVAFMVLTSYMPDASFIAQSKAAPHLSKAAQYLRKYMPEKVGMIKLSATSKTEARS
jgi:membrane protein required for colicin V production